ncbi:hypothetical protein [Tropicimonas marinistellae]|uniref:hypothetical protein n=1 Tax=Tropicimonas marinistellae TaxID=1739787 RepID=UPI00122E08C0|nr:hypothetical protein [Tropicimonas marinistellae]
MDQRVNSIEYDVRPKALSTEAPQHWAPPAAPLAMPKQALERPASWLELAGLGRLLLSRRKA